MTLSPLPEPDAAFPRLLSSAELTELAHMLVCFKLIPEERRGFESPLINDLLEQAIARDPSIPAAMEPYVRPLRDAFTQQMGEPGPGNRRSFLASLPDDAARRATTADFFLPLWPRAEIPLDPYTETAAAFGPIPAPEATIPLQRPLGLAKSIASIQWTLLLGGRFSERYLEYRRRGDSDKAAADALVTLFRDFILTVERATNDGAPFPPFWEPTVKTADFASSEAYVNMMTLGFSRDEMMDAIAPWELVD